mgnify:FL=1
MYQPVYDFLGFSLNEIKYINKFKENTYIGISVVKDEIIEKLSQYSLLIKITSDFAEEESSFLFQGFFKVNDFKWFKSLEENNRKSIFFAIVFPFIREKIFSITSDTKQGLFIPTLNIKDISFEKEIKLTRIN